MATNQKAGRPDYQAILKARATKLFETFCNLQDSDQATEVIYQTLKQTALESWKNGIEAGARKARPIQPKSGKAA
ncbi:MAG: hypothetical protein HY867_13625 [Chloroflexi bacterium]|nr:hypothetical protein [Chloroflexota bacterium]